MGRAKTPKRKPITKKRLPLDKPEENAPDLPPLISYVANLYATVINQFFADKNMDRLHQLIGTILSITIAVMKRSLGDEITVYELGRALRGMENAVWALPGDDLKPIEKSAAPATPRRSG